MARDAADKTPGHRADRRELSDDDYAALLEFRTSLRRFLRWSEERARASGLTPSQHQLLLAVRGHRDGRGPTIGDLAHYLLLRHHSAVGLVDRAEATGLVRRARDADDARVVRVILTSDGEAKIEALSRRHLEELERLAPALEHLAHRIDEGAAPGDGGTEENATKQVGRGPTGWYVSRGDTK